MILAHEVRFELAGLPLGSFPGAEYDEVTFDLCSGDLFVFCTDGIYDATDSAGEEFGMERALRAIKDTCNEPAGAVVDEIFAAVQAFRGEAPPNDDMTAVALRITN